VLTDTLTGPEHRAARMGGVIALMAVGLALAVPVAVLVSVGNSSGTGSSASGNQGAYLLRITRFTLMQAGLVHPAQCADRHSACPRARSTTALSPAVSG
jgi:hypothetical protein